MSVSSPYKIDVIVGARPNFVKAAPLITAMDKHPNLTARLVHTGQHDHPALSDSFFDVLCLRRPDIHLETAGGSQAVQTSKVMIAYENVLATTPPDAVIVIGDVNSTLGAAITTKKARLPLLHLEAGLRCGDKNLPEEINRLAVDAISDRFWAPSEDAVERLTFEGHSQANIALVGNFMIDSLVKNFDPSKEPPLGLKSREYGVVTLHRPSNVDDLSQLTQVLNVLEAVSQEIPLIFPVHPRLTKSKTQSVAPSITWVDPMNYEDFIHLQANARFVITDSGGIQEECSFLGIPCMTLRSSTERPVTITSGTNQLVTVGSLMETVNIILGRNMTCKSTIKGWDGNAANRAVVDLLRWLKDMT